MSSKFRIGLGHDTHRLTEGDAVILGGIRIEHSHRLLGHSDADVLLHAITDALLGAAGLEDIGQLFPDTDPNNRGRDSGEMLQFAWSNVARQGWRIVNLDCIVFAEAPKLSTYKTQIKQRIAELLGIEPSQVGVKAKTGEKVGPVGRQEAISAECIVLLENVSS